MSSVPLEVLRPVAPPVVIEGAYSEDQYRRINQVIRSNGPWRQIMANVFESAEELLAAISGDMPEGVTPTLDMFLTTHFQGDLASYGLCLYPEIADCFFNPQLLEQARAYWNAEYARPEFMHFILNGPCESNDPAHVDSAAYRGVDRANAPTWLLSVMPKSGLFRQWQKKKTQVVSWFYKGEIGGGFTYWPEGPSAQPKRVPAPMWGRAVVAENEMMYHRGESGGPLEQRKPAGLALNSLLRADPDVADGWQITTDGEIIQNIPGKEARLMLHWNGEIFTDFAELKMVMDHTDDLSIDQVMNMFCQDLRQRGVAFEEPSDPLRDGQFIRLLSRVYDPGIPKIYPAEAPGPRRRAA